MDPVRIGRRYAYLAALRLLPVGLLAPIQVLVMQHRGLSLVSIGSVLATYTATVAILELPTGNLADIIGYRTTLAIGVALSVVGLGLFSIADGPVAFAVAVACLAADRALRSGPLEAWYVESVPRRDDLVGRGLARAGVTEAGALTLGALTAGVLPLVADDVSARLTLPVAVATTVALLDLGSTLALVRDRHRIRPRASQAPSSITQAMRRSYRMLRASRELRLLVLAVAAVGLAMSSVEALWQPRFADLAGSAAATPVFGVVATVGFAGAMLGASVSPRLTAHTQSAASAASLGTAGHGLAVVVLAATRDVVPAAAAYTAVYLFVGVVSPTHKTLLHAHLPDGLRSSGVSIASLARMAAGAVGTIGLTWVADVTSVITAWLAGAAVLIASSLLYLRIREAPSTPAEEGWSSSKSGYSHEGIRPPKEVPLGADGQRRRD